MKHILTCHCYKSAPVMWSTSIRIDIKISCCPYSAPNLKSQSSSHILKWVFGVFLFVCVFLSFESEREIKGERSINLLFHWCMHSLVASFMCLDWGSNLQPQSWESGWHFKDLVTWPGFVNGGLDREGLPLIILSAFLACAWSTWHFRYPIRGQNKSPWWCLHCLLSEK